MEYEYLLRVIAAGILGALIGYERKNRMKEAGIRTHFIVAVGASLMMVISKYGFQDITAWNSIALDPSRIAAQVVSGVGFLGAGMIFLQKQTIKGLTTAAGIWATAGVGMAIGSGLYVVGGGVALIILIGQIMLHRRYSWLVSPKTEQLIIHLANEPGGIDEVRQLLKEKRIMIVSFQAETNLSDGGEITLEMSVRPPSDYDIGDLLPLINQCTHIRAVEFNK
ncbi:MgtC/SapB family protein [Paenibacillus solisilvae]|uniref:MgtC/SapB family protein n=1 Tax=Paenibacillus solisilvae TaxID=2486751 RepID=A0ABW0W1N0_9BACL